MTHSRTLWAMLVLHIYHVVKRNLCVTSAFSILRRDRKCVNVQHDTTVHIVVLFQFSLLSIFRSPQRSIAMRREELGTKSCQLKKPY